MESSILITDCLQHDFIGPIGRFSGLPNSLHVGHDESLRLLGASPAEGPIARMMAWAHGQSALKVIHIRDWHNPDDPEQRTHLEQFGPHCVRGTPGAEFVFPFDAEALPHVTVVDATKLSNFVDTKLDTVLQPYKGRPVRVGLMGVWTEAKITFLAYDLRSRYPDFQLAVCSALTASSSRENHFLALDQLERILGVEVISSVGEFVDYLGNFGSLGGQTEDAPLIGFSHKHPIVSCKQGMQLSATDSKLLRYLFRGCQQVDVRILDGGFSGNLVVGTNSVDLHGHQQVPHVVKIGPRDLIGRERISFERIEAVLGNSAPQVADFADLDDRGAIKYRYAAMGGSQSRSLQALYQAGLDQQQLHSILHAVFDEQLGRFYRAGRAEYCNLFDYYDFKPDWAPSVAAKVKAILGYDADTLEFPNGRQLPNIARFYDRTLQKLPAMARSHYFSYVHGDLNGANIIIDQQKNVWLIDFFHTHRGHVLRDLIKFENDVMFIFTRLDTEQDLVEAQRISEQIMAVHDLAAPLPELDPPIQNPELQRAWGTLQILRAFYPPLIHADRDPIQWLIAHIRYAVHTLGFDECTPLQKRWALYSACLAADILQRRLSRTGPLRIDWLPSQYTGPGKLGITFLPGRRDYGRSLADDLHTLHREGVNCVMCLITPDEFSRYGVDNLLNDYRENQIEVKHLPIVDGRVPSESEIQNATQWISQQLQTGHNVLLHCVGGLGRAGTVAACYLRTLGLDGETAIREVRAARSPRAIETEVQERFICSGDWHRE